MTITELIAALEQLRAAHGDLRVVSRYSIPEDQDDVTYPFVTEGQFSWFENQVVEL